MGYGGCEPRTEGIVQCTKRYCTILRKLKNVGEGEGQHEPIIINGRLRECHNKIT